MFQKSRFIVEIKLFSCRDNNITIFAVGVGTGFRRKTLREIAVNESAIFEATDFSNLNMITDNLVEVIEEEASSLEG